MQGSEALVEILRLLLPLELWGWLAGSVCVGEGRDCYSWRWEDAQAGTGLSSALGL